MCTFIALNLIGGLSSKIQKSKWKFDQQSLSCAEKDWLHVYIHLLILFSK